MLEEGMMWQANDLLRLSSWNVSRMSIKATEEQNPSKGVDLKWNSQQQSLRLLIYI